MGIQRWSSALLLGILVVVVAPAIAQDPQDTAEPQIVRVRSLEGDVRVARGDAGDAEWEQAEADLPLESGFNLATGAGRAEIEFEDGSTVYLGENSALKFDDLSTTGNVPHTQIELLTGIATLHLQTEMPGELFVLKTPTDRITTAYPGRRYVRVNAYLDAIAMTPQIVARGKTTAGATVFHNGGKVVEGEGDPKAFAAWDQWVAGRVALREAELKAVSGASGLPASTPGLADMQGQGAFFACAPYGTCWEPPAESAPARAQAPTGLSVDEPDFDMIAAPAEQTIYAGGRAKTTISAVGFFGFGEPIDIAATLPQGFTCVTPCAGQISPGQNALTMQFQAARSVAPGTYTVQFEATSGPLAHQFTFTIYVVEADFMPFEPIAASLPEFPCYPSGVHPAIIRTGRDGIHVGYGPRYGWAVCHTGTWIFRNHIYVWVLPTKGDHHHHHHPPCKWVKCGDRYCYVPVHPRDERGKLPINCKHDVYRVGDKKGRDVERVSFDKKERLEALDGPPKEFRRPGNYPLAKADAPVLRARGMKDAFVAKSALAADGTATTLKFDRDSRQFLLATEVPGSKKHELVTETFEEHRSGLRVENHHVVPASGGAHGAGPARGNAPHGGGGGSHPGGGASHAGSAHSGGASHAGGGGSHSSAPSHSGGGGSHASAPSHAGGGGSHSSPAPSSTHHK
ncbi:MAG TPA: FecR family protein [Acidobacteriaceae bacterium]|nr:FecR family protein [Acidobacteriaceae bacterium]